MFRLRSHKGELASTEKNAPDVQVYLFEYFLHSVFIPHLLFGGSLFQVALLVV